MISPLHIDFVVTFQNKQKTIGYWFITWINGKNSVEVWRKKMDRGWSLEADNANHMDYKRWANDTNNFDPNKRHDVNYIEDGFIFAKFEKASELDDILFSYMNNNGFPYKPPYKYWLDPGEPDPNDSEY